jgi:alkylation response protein AidB-like acyl-CoA dehydrogenase
VSSAADLVKWATEQVPVLRERGGRCEELRRIPPETVTELMAAGVHRIAQPEEFGGMGLGLDTVAEVGMEVGQGCGSTAWMATQWPGHNFMVGMFPREAQAEYWSDGPDVLSSTASAFVEGTFDSDPGGMRVRGRWKFSSGVDEARWILLTTPEQLCLVPRSEFEVDDDWFVAGLRGSGSKSVVIGDTVVPRHRMVPMEAMANGHTPGAETYGGTYRVPFALWAPGLLASAVVGMARGIVDLFDERAATRIDTQTSMPARERPGIQMRFGYASAQVDVARMLVRKTFADVTAWSDAEAEIPLSERARSRRDLTYGVKLCLDATDQLLEAGDASAIYDSQPIQRLARDLHAAALQVSLVSDEPAVQYSRVHWGMPPESRVL